MKKTSELITNKRLPLDHLAQKINHLRAINQSLQLILPSELRSYCQVANINEQQCLVLLVNNSHWLTSLRFMAPELLKKLQVTYPTIRSIKTIVSRYTLSNNAIKQNTTELTVTASRIITEFAKGVDDPLLQQALIKLAKNAKPS